jgi:hypothetical protein
MLAVTQLVGFGAGWSFPRLVGSAITTGTGSTVNATLPTDYQAGDLLLACITHDRQNSGNGTGGANSNFTGIGSNILLTGRSLRTAYRIADGSEGSSQSFNFSLGVKYAVIMLAFRGFLGTPEGSTGASGSSGTSADPDAVTPSWGAAQSAFVAVAASEGYGSPPTGYVNTLYPIDDAGVTDTVTVAIVGKQVSSEDPGAFTVSSGYWAARTVAIRGMR